MAWAIVCRDLTKSFLLEHAGALAAILFGGRDTARFTALKEVSVAARAGEFVGVLGHNGAGKSTLLRIIGGVYAPDAGTVTLDGDLAAIYELGITGNDLLTGRQFATRWFEVFGARGRSRAEVIAEAHDFSELAEAFDRPIRGYSAGMKARLFFALATALPADVYVIDEVLAVGDEYFQNKCWRRLRERLAEGAGGIIATHDWTAILRLCPRSVILDHGRIAAEGPSPEMVRRYLKLDVAAFAEGARFTGLPAEVTASALRDLTLAVDVEATGDGEWLFGLAIERFIAGSGWEHVLHADPAVIGAGPGRFRATVTFPHLPLPEGDYALALFLSRREGAGPAQVVDARSWTYGNGLALRVAGEASRGAIRRPIAPVFSPVAAHAASAA